ncbi:zeta-sarcoglycan-like isoform X2 [Genypterus blacodes]|uniref:zeta-sarcoglycan-like isoform X2 n=1 Tax=Genypterus blacodes TaxID=154954 RepID=UPI003F764DCD
MEQSTTLDIETLKITQEQFILASQSLHLQRPACEAVYPVGLYGWRKRCLYFFLLLLMVTMIVNLALTVWIIKVMNFSMDSVLVLRSEKNVTMNARNSQGQLTGQLTVGPEAVEAQSQRLEVRSRDGDRLLFTADEEEIIMTTEKFIVTGSEGAMFGHSIETPLIQASASDDLKLESPTRTLTMEAPRGVEVSAAKGTLKVSGRKDLQLQSTEGEILLDASTIQLGSLPVGVYTASTTQAAQDQNIYEVCVCPSGKLYLSPAESSSTCQAMSNICLWS